MILQCALLLIMDPQSHRMDFQQHPIFLGISVKVVTIEGHPEEAGHGAHSLTFISQSEQSPPARA
jgi:hypothetical protein